MSRTLVGTSASGITAAVTLPGYFVQLFFPTVLRISSRGTKSWGGYSWVETAFEVSSVPISSGSSTATATITFDNTDKVFSTRILSENVLGKVCQIYKYYTESPGVSDPVLLFEGVVEAFDINGDTNVRLSLTMTSSVVRCPRTYITPEAGFNHVPVNGQFVWFRDRRYKLVAET